MHVIKLENGFCVQGPQTLQPEAEELANICNAEMKRFTTLMRQAEDEKGEEKFEGERNDVYNEYFKEQFEELGYSRIEE